MTSIFPLETGGSGIESLLEPGLDMLTNPDEEKLAVLDFPTGPRAALDNQENANNEPGNNKRLLAIGLCN